MESRRLRRTVTCPECCYKVKPFVTRTKQFMVWVKCPRKECGKEFTVGVEAV